MDQNPLKLDFTGAGGAVGRRLGSLAVPGENMGEPDSLRARAPIKLKVTGEANFSLRPQV